jgi:hypothetical protein
MEGMTYANTYNRVSLETPVRFWIGDTAANTRVEVELQAQVKAGNSVYNLSGRHMTGPIRLSLWAVPANGQVSVHGVVGHLIARTPARMVGGQGADQDQLYHTSAAFLQLFPTGTTPPAGDYCIVLTADENTPTGTPPCLTQDRSCSTSWYTFSAAVTFQ